MQEAPHLQRVERRVAPPGARLSTASASGPAASAAERHRCGDLQPLRTSGTTNAAASAPAATDQ